MAVIGRIRKHSTILLVIGAVALLAFVLGDFTRSRNSNKFHEEFITIDKEHIPYPVFMEKYDHYRGVVKANNDVQSIPPEEDFRLGEQVYNELVDSVIMAKQTDYLGIRVTPEELRDLVAGTDPHPQAKRFFSPEGFYNMQLAQYAIDNLGQLDSMTVANYMQLETMVEKETMNNKYLNLLSSAYYIPSAFAKKINGESSLTADLEVVLIPYSNELVSDDKISFTEDEVKKCYQENKYRFKQDEEFRSVEYVIFNIEPTENDLREIEENVNKMFEEFQQTDRPDYFVNRLVDSRYDSTYFKRGVLEPAIDTLLFDAQPGTFIAPYIDRDYWKFAKLLSAQVRPDSINVSYVAISHTGTQENHRTKEESQKRADTAYTLLMAGLDIQQVSKQYTDGEIYDDPEQNKIWIVDGIGQQVFFDTLYKFAPGSIVKYEAPAATFIFKINERTQMERKIRVAIGKKQILASSETINNIESAANNFVNGTDTYKKFVDAVVAQNLNKRTNDRVMRMSYSLPGIREGGREIVRWIFGEKTEKGTVSNVFLIEDMYVVVVLKDIYPEGYRTLDDEQVRNQIEAIVKREKKAEKLEAMLKESLLKNTDLNTIATNNKVEEPSEVRVAFSDRNFGHYGPELKVIGRIFGISNTGKVEILRGETGVYAVKIKKLDVPTFEAASTNDNAADMIIQQNRMMYQNRVERGGMLILRKTHIIKDNRDRIM